MRIMDILKPFGAVADVRLIRNKVTGESRGFAFVDFTSVPEAQSFMEHHNGSVVIDGRNVSLDYSTSGVPAGSNNPGFGGGGQSAQFKDWICPHCQASNFARRTACFMCQAAKPTNPTPAPLSHEEVPSGSLIVRGLDPYTIEESIRYAFSSYAQVKDVRLMRDKGTGTSRCFAFVEFFSINDAATVLREGGNVRIDGNTVRMSYARPQDAHGPKPNTFAEQALWAQQWNSNYDQVPPQQWNEDGKTAGPPAGFALDTNTGFFYNSTTGYYYDERTRKYLYYDEANTQFMYFDQLVNKYLPYNPPKPLAPSPSGTDAENASPTSTSTTPASSNPTIAAPPVISKPAVISAPPQAASVPKEPPNQPAAPAVPAGPVKMTLGGAKDSKINKKSVPTIFQKKISKEMERWNQKGKELKEAVASETAEQKHRQESRKQAQAHLSGENATPVGKAPSQSTSPIEPNIPTPSPSEIVASTMSAVQNMNTPIVSKAPAPVEPAATPTPSSQPVCLLCKRQFSTPEALLKHETMSDLHKFNLEQLRQRQSQQAQWAKDNPLEEDASLYVSRPPPKQQRNTTAKEEAPAQQLDESNIGFKMLKNSGWKEGTGLGKGGSGITAPVEVTIRSERAGLGSDDDARHAVKPGDSYQQATRKKALSRFEAISGVNVNEIERDHPFLQKSGSSKKSKFS